MNDVFDVVLAEHPEATDIWVVSGLTDLGIPGFAYRVAKDRNWMTGGIACAKAANHDCFKVDKRRIVGDNWGDESETFLNEIDVLVRIGGGKQSLAEVAMFKERDGKLYERELKGFK